LVRCTASTSSRIGPPKPWLANERGISNATFEVGSVFDYPLEPLSLDVVLFMAVWGKTDNKKTVGGDELARILAAARRQIVMRVGVQRYARKESRLEEILEVCDRSGFDALCFRRPTALLTEHPVVASSEWRRRA
jgi:hypothetical protein